MKCNTEDVFLRKIDFHGSTTVYSNRMMKGMRYRLLRDKDSLLEPGIEYEARESGGFELKGFEMGEDSIIVVQFY